MNIEGLICEFNAAIEKETDTAGFIEIDWLDVMDVKKIVAALKAAEARLAFIAEQQRCGVFNTVVVLPEEKDYAALRQGVSAK